MNLKERSSLERERENARTQLRTQLANHATAVFVALNAGGLAAALTWLQSLPIDSATYSCNGVLLRTVSWAAGLLLCGVIATATSYLLRYHAPDPGKIQRGWMIALSVSAATLIGAGALVSYTALNCRMIAVNQRTWADVEFQFSMAKFSGRTEEDVIDESRARGEEARREAEYAILTARFEERVEEETRIKKLQELRAEVTKRIDTFPPDEIPSELQKDLDRINILDAELQADLRK